MTVNEYALLKKPDLDSANYEISNFWVDPFLTTHSPNHLTGGWSDMFGEMQ
mgnify:CR=1 FL=1